MTNAKEVDFSTFAQLTAPFLKGEMSQAEYARTLILSICDYVDLNNNPVDALGDDAFKRYYTGERSISSLAAKIVPHLDSEQLEPMFDRLGFEAQMGLYKSLSPYCPNMTDRNVTEEAPRMLARIITAASYEKRGTRKQAGLQTLQGEGDSFAYIQEANCRCALCGQKLIKMSSGKVAYVSDITRITPSSLNSAEVNELTKEGVELPEPGSPNDFIALCPNCSKNYLASYDKDGFKHLLGIKRSLQKRNAAADQLGKCDIEEEIETVLEALCTLSSKEIEANLRLDALALKDKIEESEPLLKDRIRTDVAQYYRYIEDSFRRLSEVHGVRFNRTIAAQVQMAYLAASSFDDSQSMVYESLVDWLHERVPTCERIACGIVVSFFVQNCEVFDEITR